MENRLAYYEALDQSMTYKNTETFIKLISDPALKEWKDICLGEWWQSIKLEVWQAF